MRIYRGEVENCLAAEKLDSWAQKNVWENGEKAG